RLLSFLFCYGARADLHSFPTRRSSDLHLLAVAVDRDRPPQERADHEVGDPALVLHAELARAADAAHAEDGRRQPVQASVLLHVRSEEHTSELQSLAYLVCRLLLEKKKK